MGDIGSMGIAFWILALIGLLVIKTENIKYLLFLTVYGIDVVFTILERLKLKENIFEAHRSHLYQFFANENKTNRLVISAIYGILQLLVGFVIIYATNQSITFQWITALVLMLIGTTIYLVLKQNLIKKHQIV